MIGRKIQIRLLMSLAILSIGLAIHSTAKGQETGFAVTSPKTLRADDCESQLKVELERLDKTLDAYEKATKALTAAQNEIVARQSLDALKDQLIAVKDLIINEQDKLIQRLQGNKNSLMSKSQSHLHFIG